jgi:hypothetical protein
MESEGGPFLRPRYWNIDERTAVFHKEYVDFYNENQEGLVVFSLSVWRNEKIALENYSDHLMSHNKRGEKDVILMRIPRNAEGLSELSWTDDDLLQGKALLLYQIGPHDPKKVYGTVGIPWQQIEFCRTPWRPMLSREWMSPKEYILVDHPLSTHYKYHPYNSFFDENLVPIEELQLRSIINSYGKIYSARQRLSGIRRLLQPISFMKADITVNSYKHLARIVVDLSPAYQAAAMRIIATLDKEDKKREILEELVEI